MALKAGFSQAVTFFTSTSVPIFICVSLTFLSPMPVLLPAEEKVEMLLCGPGNEAQLASMTEQQRTDLRKAIAEHIRADIARGVPLNHEALVLVVRK